MKSLTFLRDTPAKRCKNQHRLTGILTHPFCSSQEKFTDSQTAGRPSSRGPGMLQPGQHLHVDERLWDVCQVPPEASPHCSGTLWQSGGGQGLLEPGQCQQLPRQPQAGSAVCQQTFGDIKRGEMWLIDWAGMNGLLCHCSLPWIFHCCSFFVGCLKSTGNENPTIWAMN